MPRSETIAAVVAAIGNLQPLDREIARLRNCNAGGEGMWGDSCTFKGCGLAKALPGIPFAADLKVVEYIARAATSTSFGNTSIVSLT